MKITIVQGAFLPVPPLMGGAVEKSWFMLAKEFARRGHDVTHISRIYKDMPREESISGVHHLRVKGFDAPKSGILLKLLDLVYSLRVIKNLPEADILVTNTFWLPLLINCTKYGALYIHVARYPKGQMKLYRRAARLQAISDAVSKAIIREYPSAAGRVRVIQYPVPEEAASFNEEELFKGKEKSILYAGRIHPEKGIGLLIEAFKSLVEAGIKDWRLQIVGPWETKFGGGGKNYYDGLLRKSQDISDLVQWTGPVFDTSRLLAYYRKASIFVYPSLAETGDALSLAVLEATACGCVCLVSDLGCFRDIVEPGKTGFVFNHRAANPIFELSEEMKRLISSPEVLLRARRDAFAKSKEFTLDKIADKFIADFETLVKR